MRLRVRDRVRKGATHLSRREHVRTVSGASVARQRETRSAGGKRADAPNLCTYLRATSARPLPTSIASCAAARRRVSARAREREGA